MTVSAMQSVMMCPEAQPWSDGDWRGADDGRLVIEYNNVLCYNTYNL